MLFVPETNFKVGFACLLAALALTLAWPGSVRPEEPSPRWGTISAFKLNVRSGPSQASQVVATVEQGQVVEIVRVEGGIGGWVTVVVGGQTGYVRNRPRYITFQKSGKEAAVSAPKILIPKTDKSQSRTIRRHKDITEKLESETRKMDRISEKEARIMDGLNEIDYALNQARIKAQALTRENMKLSRDIRAIRDQSRDLTHAMASTREYADQRLEALYRMQMMGRLEMAGAPSSLFDFVVTQRSMERIVTADYTLLSSQASDLEELSRLETELTSQVAVKTALENELSFQIRIKEKESDRRQAILREIREKKQWSEAAIASLKEAAETLAARLEALGLTGSPGLDDTSFVKQKGRLSVPVHGEIVSRYGRTRNGDYNAFTFQSGIDIRVERGEPVRSVFKGEVMFADWLKGYGNLLIINHGDNYYTLYAHVEEIFKKKGETVSTGEVIATAGDTGSIKGMQLHFEVRYHGRPVDPMAWLKQGA